MTNKDTERLVQQAMQQSIPDKEALWAKIEADLPQQPVFGKIRKTSVRTHTIYRVMGAAACFLLIAGGLGTLSTVHFSKSNNMESAMMTADAPQYVNRQEQAADNIGADMYDEDDYGDAGDDADSGDAEYIGEVKPEVNHVYGDKRPAAASKNEDSEALSAADEAAPAEGEDEAAPMEIMEITVHGRQRDIAVEPEMLDAVVQSIPGREAALQERTDLGAVRKSGVLVWVEHSGRNIVLTALDGTYRMTVDGVTFYATEAAADLLHALEED